MREYLNVGAVVLAIAGREKGEIFLIAKDEGEYAYLHDLSGNCKEDLFIALALLPQGVDLGTKLHYEMFEYTVAE